MSNFDTNIQPQQNDQQQPQTQQLINGVSSQMVSDSNNSPQQSESLFVNKIKYILMIIHGGINVFQYAICMSLLNPILADLPKILSWSESEVQFFTGFVNSANTAGAAIGCISAGYLSALYGRRTLFMIGDVFCIAGSLLSLIGNTVSFIIGRFICGIGMGILVDLAILFIVEWTYYIYRGKAGAPMVCFTPLGLISSSLLGLKVQSGGSDFWKIIISVPAIISGVHLLGYLLFFTKDSPFFTYQKYRDDQKALTDLREIYTEKASVEILQKIKESIKNREENNVKNNHLTLSDLFRNFGYRRRMIVCTLCVISVNFSGYFIITIYTNTIIMKENNDNNYATLFSLYTNLADLFSVASAIFYVEKIGRKPIFLAGQGFVVIMLFLIGFLSNYGVESSIKYLLIIFKIGFGWTISPLYPVILSEIMPEVGFVVSSIIFWVLNTAIVQLFPYLNASDLGFSGIFWLFGAIMLVDFIFLAIYMKETKGKTLVEIDQMYNQNVNNYQLSQPRTEQDLNIKSNNNM